MGIEQPIMSGAVRTSGFFISPLGKINLIVTAVFFLILAFVGTAESFEQHSFYPLFSRSILPIVGADVSISNTVDSIESSNHPIYSGVLSKSFPSVLWFWLKNTFLLVSAVWFIYFFVWLLYWLFSLSNSALILRNILLALGSFILITMFVGMIMYNVNLSGKCLVDDKNKVFNGVLINSYPLHGTVKLVSHIFNRNLFNRVVDFSQTDLGYAITNIPKPVMILNDSVNDTNVSVS